MNSVPTNRSWVRVRLVALVLVLAVAGTGLTPYVAVGDSVTNSAREELTARGAYVRAHGGMTIVLGRPVLREVNQRGYETVVVALGGMDVALDTTPTALRWRVRSALQDLVGVRCVIWLNLNTQPNVHEDWPQVARAFNRMLNQLMRSRPQRHIAQWSGVAARHPGWFVEDGIHLTAQGQVGFARFVARAADRQC